MNSSKDNKKYAIERKVVISEQENKKIVNPISIALIILSIALFAAAVHFLSDLVDYRV